MRRLVWSRGLGLVVAVAVLGLALALAVALALALRMPLDALAPTPTVTPLPTETAARTPPPADSPTATPGAEFTPTPAATRTPLPTATPTAAGTPTKTPTQGPPPPLGRLQIPKLGLDAKILPLPIVNGDWDTKRIVMEVGWLAGTAQIGQQGNIGIAGHVSLKCCGDGPFRWLEKMAPGDLVSITTDAGTTSYRVVETRVLAPTEVDVLLPTDQPQVTLVTCYDWDYFSAQFTKRFVVIAR